MCSYAAYSRDEQIVDQNRVMTLYMLELRGKQGACHHEELLPFFHVETARTCPVERERQKNAPWNYFEVSLHIIEQSLEAQRGSRGDSTFTRP